MAQQQIITKPYVGELQDNDSLFINHDGALRQIKKSDADFASGADMRAEVAARKEFEAQEVAAREAFEKSETEARGQFETNVGEQIAEKANVDGCYEEMTVGDAEQLVATQFVENNEPYLFRSTGGSSDVGNRAYLDKIVGGTVAWNQQVDTSKALLTTIAGVTLSRKDNGKLFLSGTATGGIAWCIIGEASLVVGHKYISASICENVPLRIDKKDGNIAMIFNGNLEVKTLTEPAENKVYAPVKEGVIVNTEINPFIIDLTQMFGSTIADYIYSLEQSQAGAGVAWFKKLFPKDYYPYNAGELLSVEGLQSHDTVGFNQWDEEWEVGNIGGNTGEPIVSTTVWRSKNFIRIVPSASYYAYSPTSKGRHSIRARFYDANQQYICAEDKNGLDVSTEQPFIVPDNAHYMKFSPFNSELPTHELCINLSDPSRNGEYEPYEKHSYPLDSSLTLRGIPKLDASNNLYYDGDEYTSDGKVKRKYAEYIFTGSEHWVWYEDSNQSLSFWHCSPLKYNSEKSDDYFCSNGIRATVVNNTQVRIYARSNPQISSSTNMNALFTSGTKLVYKLSTPTTETAKPFQHIQIVDDFGTEEFVSTGIVPVGHKTRYPANLRDKLQHLPDLAGMDGTYLIRQTGKQMSLIHMPAVFPETPTEDGTYTLKTVVTGGVATLQWVAE